MSKSKTVAVLADRPLGSTYPGIPAPDGEEQDAYILGVDHPIGAFTGEVVAIVHRFDDVEEKWVVASGAYADTKEEIRRQVQFQERYFPFEIRFPDEIVLA